MKKAIVTGATGFIGSAFVEYLIKKDIILLALILLEIMHIFSKMSLWILFHQKELMNAL